MACPEGLLGYASPFGSLPSATRSRFARLEPIGGSHPPGDKALFKAIEKLEGCCNKKKWRARRANNHTPIG